MINSVAISSHGTAIPTEIFPPAGINNGGAIVVAHGSDGMSEPWANMIREYAIELSGKGFTTLIPSYFEKTRTVAGPSVFAQLPANLNSWVEAAGDVVTHAKTLPGIVPGRVGLLGFSLGGHICLRLRKSSKALVAFFAPELRPLGGIGTERNPAPRIEIHHGLSDPLVPFSEAQAIAAVLKLEGVVPEVFAYEGAGHGFAGADPNNATARRSSKGRTLSFFEKHLMARSEAHHAR